LIDEGIGAARRGVKSPCIEVCAMGNDGLCAGCFRTLEEIATWGAMDDSGRLQVISRLEGRRAVAKSRA
jgi:predicted Fe-S protein YdhL (DUF1289 family)